MTKSERIVRLFCNYVIDNELRTNDPDEGEYGQCVDLVSVKQLIEGTNIRYESLTLDDLHELSSFSGEVCRNNDLESDECYGEIVFVRVRVDTDDTYVEIWDGY